MFQRLAQLLVDGLMIKKKMSAGLCAHRAVEPVNKLRRYLLYAAGNNGADP